MVTPISYIIPMSYFASSASPEVAHWHEAKPIHLMESHISEGFHDALNSAKEVIVNAEYKLAELASELGIEHFGHQISCDLTGCKLVLQPHGHLEIHRKGQKYATSFPVQLIA
jgi:hypothetical protein